MDKDPEKRWFSAALAWGRQQRWPVKTLVQVVLAQLVAWLIRRWLG